MRVLFFIFLSICIKLPAQYSNDSILYWNENRKLRWTDFRGVLSDLDISSNMIAITPSEINVQTYWNNDLPDFKVFVYFSIYKAWTKDTSSLSVLAHEQLHFDISELFARKIRKKVQEMRLKKVDNIEEYSKVIKLLLAERRKINNMYDQETLHGNFAKNQKEWQEKVKKELYGLKDYEVNYLQYLEEL